MFGDRLAQENRRTREHEQRQRVAEPPGQAVLDNIPNVGPASGKARHRRDMIGFERMLHSEQKPDTQDSEHALPDLTLTNNIQATVASRLLPIPPRGQPYQFPSPAPLRAET